MKVNIEESWYKILEDQFSMPYFNNLVDFLKQEKRDKKIIYPPGPLIFSCFELTPFYQTKVVILGQDPYHNPNQAMGLSFSVPDGEKIPPSLSNIFAEITDDLNIQFSKNGNLSSWAKQGILLLNSILTVRKNEPASHSNKGWEIFTENVISKLSDKREGLVFVLWGNYARQKANLIDRKKHAILEAPHPSPLSAYHGFMGCRHFSQINEILIKQNKEPINWKII